jgi:hypothetical protein
VPVLEFGFSSARVQIGRDELLVMLDALKAGPYMEDSVTAALVSDLGRLLERSSKLSHQSGPLQPPT